MPFNRDKRACTSRVAPRPRTAATGERAMRDSGTRSDATTVRPSVAPRVPVTSVSTAGIAGFSRARTASSKGGSSTFGMISSTCPSVTVVRATTCSVSSSPMLSTPTARGRSTPVFTGSGSRAFTSVTGVVAGARSANPSLSEPSRGGAARKPRSDACAVRLPPARRDHSAAMPSTVSSSAATGSSPANPRMAVNCTARAPDSLTKGSGWRVRGCAGVATAVSTRL